MNKNDLTPRQFIESLLPSHYDVHEGITGCIGCRSRIGIITDRQWEEFMRQVKEYFGKSLKEVYHHTCTNHVHFSVYYDYASLNNLEFSETGAYKLKQQNK